MASPPRDGYANGRVEAGGAGVPDPDEAYRSGLEHETSRIGSLEASASGLSRIRAALFLLLAVCILLADPLDGSGEPLALAGAVSIAVVFGVLVVRHARLRREARRHETLARLHRLGLARISRAWDRIAEEALPQGPPADVSEDHPFAADLHAFGRVSLFALLGPVTTVPGRRIVAEWLSSPASAATVRDRQSAVRALAGKREFRHRFAALGIEGPSVEPGTIPLLLGWCTDEPWLGRVPGIGVVAVVVPLLTLGLLTADLVAGWPAIWLLPLVAQVMILRRFHGRISESVARLSVGAPAVGRYASQIDAMEELPRAPLLGDLRDAFFEGRDPHVEGRRLRSARSPGGWSSRRAARMRSTGRWITPSSSTSTCTARSSGGETPTEPTWSAGSRCWAKSRRYAPSRRSRTTTRNGPSPTWARPEPSRSSWASPSDIPCCDPISASETTWRSAPPAPSCS